MEDAVRFPGKAVWINRIWKLVTTTPELFFPTQGISKGESHHSKFVHSRVPH